MNALCSCLVDSLCQQQAKIQHNFLEIHLPVYVLVVGHYSFGVVGASLLLSSPLLSSCLATLDSGASFCSGRYEGLMADC